MRTLLPAQRLPAQRFLVLLFVPTATAALLLARPVSPTQAQGSSTPAKTSAFVTYEAGTAEWLSAPHTLQLSEGVKFGQDDATLKTDAAVALLDKDQNVISAKAQGPVHLFDAQDDLTGQHGSVDFTKHLATLRDSIRLVVKPGKREASARSGSLGKQFKDPATLTCAAMTYDYKFKIGRIPGPLTVTQVIQTKGDGQQTRVLTADAGVYNGKAQTIQLVGTIRGTYSDGSVIEGDTRTLGKPVLIHIKEGAESIFVPFPTKGHFPTKSKPDTSTDDGKDEPDLTLPAPPPHTPLPGESAAPPVSTAQAPPAAPNSAAPNSAAPNAAAAGTP